METHYGIGVVLQKRLVERREGMERTRNTLIRECKFKLCESIHLESLGFIKLTKRKVEGVTAVNVNATSEQCLPKRSSQRIHDARTKPPSGQSIAHVNEKWMPRDNVNNMDTLKTKLHLEAAADNSDDDFITERAANNVQIGKSQQS